MDKSLYDGIKIMLRFRSVEKVVVTLFLYGKALMIVQVIVKGVIMRHYFAPSTNSD
jgi:hypothetical protein